MFPPLYVILDVSLAPAPRDIITLSLDLAAAGVRLLQIRDKFGSPRELFARSRDLVARLAPLGVRVIVNDRPDIAAACGTAGAHVGQDDLPVEAARAVCGPSRWVGVSTHNIQQLRAAAATSADYLALGPVFATSTKANPDPLVGAGIFSAARRVTRKPLVAIGGITIESAAQVWGAGADSLAVARDVVLEPDPAARVRDYLAIAARCLGKE